MALTHPPRRDPLAAARARSAWWLLAPMLVVMAAVAGWPLGRTIWFSLTDAQLSDLGARRFIGLGNYLGPYGVLTDPAWWSAVRNTLAFAAVSVGLETLLGLGVALLLDTPSRVRTLLRTCVLVPWAIPTVVSAKMWGWMLHDQFGIVNHLLLAAGLIREPVAWTADPVLSLFSVVLVDVWKTTPFMALLILAALQMVPRDCYAAARIDGASGWMIFRRITLPMIVPAIGVAVVFRLLDALRVFDIVYVLTANSRETRSMSVFVRQQLVDFQQVGYGSAASTVLFLIVGACTFAVLRVLRTRAEGVA